MLTDSIPETPPALSALLDTAGHPSYARSLPQATRDTLRDASMCVPTAASRRREAADEAAAVAGCLSHRAQQPVMDGPPVISKATAALLSKHFHSVRTVSSRIAAEAEHCTDSKPLPKLGRAIVASMGRNRASFILTGPASDGHELVVSWEPGVTKSPPPPRATMSCYCLPIPDRFASS